MCLILRSCIAEARTELRPYFTNTVEIAKSCEGRGICLKDVFCAVIGDSKHRRQLEGTFRDGSWSVPADSELASFWGRAAAEYEALEASGKVPRYDANIPPPSLYAVEAAYADGFRDGCAEREDRQAEAFSLFSNGSNRRTGRRPTC